MRDHHFLGCSGTYKHKLLPKYTITYTLETSIQNKFTSVYIVYMECIWSVYIYIETQQIAKIMVQNISDHCISILFLLQWSVKICYLFFGTFFGQSNVLRLINVFIVSDLPIHSFFMICLGLPKFMQFAVYIYIYIYI